MNFLEGRLVHDDGPALRVGDHHQALPPTVHGALRAFQDGKKLVLGIRPQDLSLAAGQDRETLPAKVWMVELVGSEKLVELSCGGGVRLTAEVKAEEKFAIDQTIAVRLAPAKIMNFTHNT